jgi:hypothetical protein
MIEEALGCEAGLGRPRAEYAFRWPADRLFRRLLQNQIQLWSITALSLLHGESRLSRYRPSGLAGASRGVTESKPFIIQIPVFARLASTSSTTFTVAPQTAEAIRVTLSLSATYCEQFVARNAVTTLLRCQRCAHDASTGLGDRSSLFWFSSTESYLVFHAAAAEAKPNQQSRWQIKS